MTTIPVGALIRNRDAAEDGPGRVIGEGEGGTVKVVFEHNEDVRDVSLVHTNIVRLPLIKGMLVTVSRGRESVPGEIVEVDWAQTPQDLCVYTVDCDGREETVFESHVTPRAPASTDPLDQFGAMHWRGPFRFFTRWDMQRMVSLWYEDTEGLPTLIGARLAPSVAAIWGAKQVLCAEGSRHLICHDEAKARRHSAGMVVAEMLSEEPGRRVLVVAGGHDSRGWRWELEARFGGYDFTRVDATHLARAGLEHVEEFLEADRLVLSGDAFGWLAREHPEQVVAEEWDLVVVDGVDGLVDGLFEWGCVEQLAVGAGRFLGLCELPGEVDSARMESLIGLVDEGDASDLAAGWRQRRPVWEAMADADQMLYEEEFEAEAFGARLGGALAEAGHAWASSALDEVDSRRSAGRWLAALRQFFGVSERLVRVESPDRGEQGVERVAYEPDPGEAAICEALEGLGGDDSDSAGQMKSLYVRAFGSSPEVFFDVLERRLEALERVPAGDVDEELIERLRAASDVLEREMLAQEVIERARPIGDEVAWIASTMSLVGRWHAEAQEGCARVVAAMRWIDRFLAEEGAEDAEEGEEERPRRVLVFCRERASAVDFAARLGARWGGAVADVITSEMSDEAIDEVCERFRVDDELRVLVMDEAGARGRDVSGALGVVHLERPAAGEVRERRAATEEAEREAWIVGPGESSPGAESSAELDRGLRAATGLSWHEVNRAESLAGLLGYADGVTDTLPVRHWARMLGMKDHGVGSGVFEFGWHWNTMRRGLRSYEAPEGGLGLELLLPERRVGQVTGTFSRRRALRMESLDYLAPGHRFFDALVEDALGPTDGRATAFARELGAQARGKTFLIVVAKVHPDEEVLAGASVPRGLLRRAYRYLWPESVSRVVEIDLQARREPLVRGDFELLERIEAPYQGSHADQKLEYEVMAKAMGDTARFRAVLRRAVHVALEEVRQDRRALVNAAVGELEEALGAENACLDYLAAGDYPEAERASVRLGWRRALVASVEGEEIGLDSLAFVVGGSPEVLI